MKRRKPHCQAAREKGIKIMNVRMPMELAERLAVHSKQVNVPRTKIISMAASEYMERQNT